MDILNKVHFSENWHFDLVNLICVDFIGSDLCLALFQGKRASEARLSTSIKYIEPILHQILDVTNFLDVSSYATAVLKNLAASEI